MIYRFLDCELDIEQFALRRSGRLIPIEPRVFEVILYLVERRARMVTRNELLQQVWQGQAVVPDVLSRAICLARQTLGGSDVIRTIYTRGYQWSATIETNGVSTAALT